MSRRIDESLDRALRKLAGAGRLLVALDFDGTLAPEVDQPGGARALPEARDAVLRLIALPDTRVAFVSGRAMESLIEVADPPDAALLVGSHGIEIRDDERGDPVALDGAEHSSLERLRAALDAAIAGLDGVWIEVKPAGFAVHTRRASPEDAEHAQRDALAAARSAADTLTVRSGKNVLEFSVRSSSKGDAVERLRHYMAADAVLFAGDDVTDEDAFGVLGAADLGLKVGAGDTRATHRVAEPADVARVLGLLAALRGGAASAS